jgi:hypothetical protein
VCTGYNAIRRAVSCDDGNYRGDDEHDASAVAPVPVD